MAIHRRRARLVIETVAAGYTFQDPSGPPWRAWSNGDAPGRSVELSMTDVLAAKETGQSDLPLEPKDEVPT
jgi:hypothetical protein